MAHAIIAHRSNGVFSGLAPGLGGLGSGLGP
jgi:hypothetical protein